MRAADRGEAKEQESMLIEGSRKLDAMHNRLADYLRPADGVSENRKPSREFTTHRSGAPLHQDTAKYNPQSVFDQKISPTLRVPYLETPRRDTHLAESTPGDRLHSNALNLEQKIRALQSQNNKFGSEVFPHQSKQAFNPDVSRLTNHPKSVTGNYPRPLPPNPLASHPASTAEKGTLDRLLEQYEIKRRAWMETRPPVYPVKIPGGSSSRNPFEIPQLRPDYRAPFKGRMNGELNSYKILDSSREDSNKPIDPCQLESLGGPKVHRSSSTQLVATARKSNSYSKDTTRSRPNSAAGRKKSVEKISRTPLKKTKPQDLSFSKKPPTKITKLTKVSRSTAKKATPAKPHKNADKMLNALADMIAQKLIDRVTR